MEYQNQNCQNKKFLWSQQNPAINGNIPPTGLPYQGEQLDKPQYYKQQPHEYYVIQCPSNPFANPELKPQDEQQQQGMHDQPQLIMTQVQDHQQRMEQSNNRILLSFYKCLCSVLYSSAFMMQILLLLMDWNSVVAEVIIITAIVQVSTALWMISTFIGCWGMWTIDQALMNYYQIGMLISLLLTIISYILKFEQNDTDVHREYGTIVALLLLGMFIIISVTICFIGCGTLARQIIIEVTELKKKPLEQGNHIIMDDEQQ